MQLIDSRVLKEYTPLELNFYVREARKLYNPYANEFKMTPEQLVINNLLFVVVVAKKYLNKKIPIEDIVQYGCLGLIKASKFYDPTRGFKFISFAVVFIQQAIVAGLSEYLDFVKIPSNLKITFLRIAKFNDKYYTQNGQYPSEEILKKNFDNRSVDLYLCKVSICNLEGNVNQDSNLTYSDCIDGSIFNDSWIDDEKFLYNITIILKKLKPMQAKIIRGLYLEGKTHNDLVTETKLTSERVRQIHKDALKTIKKYLKHYEKS